MNVKLTTSAFKTENFLTHKIIPNVLNSLVHIYRIGVQLTHLPSSQAYFFILPMADISFLNV